ncbi:hypothetical protein J4212_00015 [Candidatus Woesearchaeota archaeon]|nr:hypothetical protein [Candidatus Woesearchaeota archaeon]
MKEEEHKESFEEHRETIFRWALEVKGIEKSQRIIGLHASRAIIDLLSIYLLKKGKISAGKQINHRWFKSKSVSGKLPDFLNKDAVVERLVELELLCEKLTYGSERPVPEIKKALELFKELEAEIEGMENEEK